jgi:hypothetical protein
MGEGLHTTIICIVLKLHGPIEGGDGEGDEKDMGRFDFHG